MSVTPPDFTPVTVPAAPVCTYEVLVATGRVDPMRPSVWLARDVALTLDPASDRRMARNRLRELGTLGTNWDQQGADPIGVACLAQAECLLATLAPSTPSPEITPNPNGTLTFDWETEQQAVSLEIGATRYSAFWERSQGTRMADGDLGDGLPDLVARALEALYPECSQTPPSYQGGMIDAPGPGRWVATFC
jgi:hypothetical protein